MPSDPPPGAGAQVITDPILSIEGLSKSFGPIDALVDVSLSLGEGEIRAICGENGAGKSTLVKILTGVYRADSGIITIDGKPRDIRRPQQAQELGLALVAQELSLVPHLSVLDNIWLGNATVPMLHRRRELRDQAARALDVLGIGHLGLDTPVINLSIGERQLVEISRLLARDARILILDEPTATLTDIDIERIFEALKALKREGRSVLYITHRLGEVFEICDSVTVLRNGALVDTKPVADIDREQLIEMMLGRSFVEMYPDSAQEGGAPLLNVEGLCIPGVVDNFSLAAPQGKIVCLAGQLGSGNVEVVRAIAGLVHDATGRATINGRPMALGSVPTAMQNGIIFVSEERAGEGIFLHLRVLDNLVGTRLGTHRRFGMLSWSALRVLAARLADRVGIDRARLRSTADELSGGNQQKLAFSRAIEHGQAGILLMNEPTRGVDVGARADIYTLMREFCDLGFALVMTSSDLEEVVGMSDIVHTMYRGRAIAQYLRGQAQTHNILSDITHPVSPLADPA